LVGGILGDWSWEIMRGVALIFDIDQHHWNLNKSNFNPLKSRGWEMAKPKDDITVDSNINKLCS